MLQKAEHMSGFFQIYVGLMVLALAVALPFATYRFSMGQAMAVGEPLPQCAQAKVPGVAEAKAPGIVEARVPGAAEMRAPGPKAHAASPEKAPLIIEAPPTSVTLEVPLIMQLPELPTGCEAAAVAMMLQYAGSSLTKLDVASEMPYGNDPYEGFVGNPFTETGFTIYPQALMNLVQSQVGSAVDLSGTTLEDLREFLRLGKPVCCWIADDQGYVHCVVLTGYENDSFHLNDPLEGSKDMNASDFEQIWNNNARRALSY